MPRINTVKKSQRDWGNCGRCGDPIKVGDPYRWIKKAYSYKQVRCIKSSCMFRNSDLTSSDKLSRVYAAGEMVEDALHEFVPEVHIKEIHEQLVSLAETVDEAMQELEEVSMEYEESADNMEEYFSGSMQIDEIREKADDIESWRDEFDQAKDTLDNAIEELQTYIDELDRYRDEHAIPEGTDIIITDIEGFNALVADEEGNLEPFDTSQIDDAISELENATTSCPI